MCVFRVTLPYLIFLVIPKFFFHVFLKKKKKKKKKEKQSVAGIKYIY